MDEARFVYGFPPKVIWLWTGNCSTERIASLLQFNAAFIAEFGNNESDSLLDIALNN